MGGEFRRNQQPVFILRQPVADQRNRFSSDWFRHRISDHDVSIAKELMFLFAGQTRLHARDLTGVWQAV